MLLFNCLITRNLINYAHAKFWNLINYAHSLIYLRNHVVTSEIPYTIILCRYITSKFYCVAYIKLLFFQCLSDGCRNWVASTGQQNSVCPQATSYLTQPADGPSECASICLNAYHSATVWAKHEFNVVRGDT